MVTIKNRMIMRNLVAILDCRAGGAGPVQEGLQDRGGGQATARHHARQGAGEGG